MNIRDALDKAFDSTEEESLDEAPTSLPDTNVQAAEPASQDLDNSSSKDESEQESSDLGASPKDSDGQPITAEKVKQDNASSTDPNDKAPASWKADAKEEWASVSPKVKAEIVRREREFQKTLRDSSTARTVYDQLGQILEPHMETFTAAKVHPFSIINELLNQGRTLWGGSPDQKAAIVAKIIQDCGVDVSILDQTLHRAFEAKKDPTVSYLQEMIQKELGPIKASLNRPAVPTQPVQATIEDSTMDKLKAFAVSNKHFDAVREDMADLIELAANKGATLSLEEAYKKACLLNGIQDTPPPANNVSIGGSPQAEVYNQSNPVDLRGIISTAMDRRI